MFARGEYLLYKPETRHVDLQITWRPAVARSTLGGPEIAQSVRTSNLRDPTPICIRYTPYTCSILFGGRNGTCKGIPYIPVTSTVAKSYDRFRNFSGFQESRTKRWVNAFYILWTHTIAIAIASSHSDATQVAPSAWVSNAKVQIFFDSQSDEPVFFVVIRKNYWNHCFGQDIIRYGWVCTYPPETCCNPVDGHSHYIVCAHAYSELLGGAATLQQHLFEEKV